MRRILAVVTVLLGASVAGVAHAESSPEWTACPGAPDARQECTTVTVPMDYRNPAGARIGLAVSRIRTATPAARRGVLVLVPGGPGGAGIDRPSTHGLRLPREVLDRYDIVGFDPRGVGRSTPVSCGLIADDAHPVNRLPFPGPDGDVAGNVDRARRVADACARNGGELLRHITTRNVARDLDRVRRALGERRLSMWGVSYGTYVSAVHATMFPSSTDRVVLDSSDDPDPTRVARGWLANFAVGAEDRFPDFAAWAADRHDTYGLGDTPTAVRNTFLRLAGSLDRAPLPELTGAGLRATMFTALNTDATFPVLAQLMRAARTSGPLPTLPVPSPGAAQNSYAVFTATACNDVAWPKEDHARAVAANRRAFPLTDGMPVNVIPCAFWPYAPRERATRVGGPAAAGVLLVQNLRDPATPHSAAEKMRAALGPAARMVSVDAGGHGSYLATGNACGDGTVTAFLAHGVRPAFDLTCRGA